MKVNTGRWHRSPINTGTVYKDVPGLKMDGTGISGCTITVRITGDSIGKTISFADEKDGVMLMLPLESIEDKLKEIL